MLLPLKKKKKKKKGKEKENKTALKLDPPRPLCQLSLPSPHLSARLRHFRPPVTRGPWLVPPGVSSTPQSRGSLAEKARLATSPSVTGWDQQLDILVGPLAALCRRLIARKKPASVQPADPRGPVLGPLVQL